ncbi:MAG: Imm30 family immunity protein [Oscillatoriaceae cyanobacterium Prado104]|jgi:hypothetical protein|nr:Imm30 family immunity protein [Oscillatoriaceae cyanobacterium Prado104]
MKEKSQLEVLAANKLMRSTEEVTAFENALVALAENPHQEDLPNLHLILDDRCEQPEVMFGLIHFLESFEVSAQLKSFVKVVPELIIVASEWTIIIHNRVLNDEIACHVYRDILSLFNAQKPHFVRELLEQSATYHLNAKKVTIKLVQKF